MKREVRELSGSARDTSLKCAAALKGGALQNFGFWGSNCAEQFSRSSGGAVRGRPMSTPLARGESHPEHGDLEQDLANRVQPPRLVKPYVPMFEEVNDL